MNSNEELNKERNMEATEMTKQSIKVIQKDFKCNKCDKVFKQKYLLNRHFVVHTGERKFVCSVCGKAFKLRSTLNRHNITHQEKKTFSCTLCPKYFSRASSLKTHMAIHAKSKNYQCSLCGKDFVQKGNLASHMNIHSRERPYKCNICDCGFNQPSNLKQHIFINHLDGKKYVPPNKPSLKRTVKRSGYKMSRKTETEKFGSLSQTIKGNVIADSISNDGQTLESSQITEPESFFDSTNESMLMSDGVLNSYESSPLLPVVDKDPPHLNSRLLNKSSSILLLVNNETGEITVPVIQRNQVFQLMVNNVDPLSDTQQLDCDPTPLSTSSSPSNLCFDDMLSERFDPRTLQTDSTLFDDSIDDTIKWYNSMDMCTDLNQ